MPWCIFVFVSSSSLAGVSPVRVAARRPGSRLAASSGNGRGRSPASEALLGGATGCGPQRYAKPAASLEVRLRGGSRGSRAAEITVKAMEAVKCLEAQP